MALGKKKIQMQGAAGITATDHFDIKIEDGISGSHTIDFDIVPDWVWIKFRNKTSNHYLFTSMTGDKLLNSNSDADLSSVGFMDENDWGSSSITFDNNLFGTNSNYVAWAWKAGGAAASNTNGSTASQVSANTDAGFSIVKYSGSDSNATIGHGLSSPPEFIMVKNISTSNNWCGSSDYIGWNNIFGFDYTLQARDFDFFLDTSPTSQVFSVKGNIGLVNDAGEDYIAYCFHSVDGYQKVGSYTGVSGDIEVETGFRPRFIMIKNSSGTGNWEVHDSVRHSTINTENGLSKRLRWNDNSAEAPFNNTPVFFRDTGFTLDSSVTENTYIDYDKNGDTFIYLAIA